MLYFFYVLILFCSGSLDIFPSQLSRVVQLDSSEEKESAASLHLMSTEQKLQSVSADSREALAKSSVLKEGFVTQKSLIGDKRILVKKTEVKEFLSRFCQADHLRPARTSDNPFVLVPFGDEQVRFVHSYKELNVIGAYKSLPSSGIRYSYVGDERRRFEEDFIGAGFFEYQEGDKVWGNRYSMNLNWPSSEKCRVLVGPDTNRVIAFFNQDQQDLSLCYLYDDEEDWKPGGIAFNHPLLGYGMVECFQTIQYGLHDGNFETITAISLFKGLPRTFDPDVPIWDSIPTKEELDSMEKSVLLSGTRSGKVYVHYFKPTVKDIEYTEVPIKLTGQVRDVRISKDAKVAWVLDEVALHTYNLDTKEQRLICKLPDNCGADADELMKTFTLSANENYALLGGSKGTVLLVDVQAQDCYVFEQMPPHEIVDMWWSEKNEIVILSRSGMIKSFKLSVL